MACFSETRLSHSGGEIKAVSIESADKMTQLLPRLYSFAHRSKEIASVPGGSKFNLMAHVPGRV